MVEFKTFWYQFCLCYYFIYADHPRPGLYTKIIDNQTNVSIVILCLQVIYECKFSPAVWDDWGNKLCPMASYERDLGSRRYYIFMSGKRLLCLYERLGAVHVRIGTRNRHTERCCTISYESIYDWIIRWREVVYKQ